MGVPGVAGAPAAAPAVTSAVVRTPPATATAALAAAAVSVFGVAALAAGLLLGRPLFAVLLVAGALAVALLLVRPVACLVLLTVVEMANVSGVADQHGLPDVYLANLALGAAAAVVAVRRGRLRPAWSPVFLTGLLFVTVQLVSSLLGQGPSASSAVVEANAKGLVWLAVVTVLMLVSPKAPTAAARALVATLAALALVTLVQQFVLHNSTDFGGLANVPLGQDIGAATSRHAGPQADVNFWGRLLVMGLPFAFSLAQLARGRARTLGWLAAGLAVLGGIVLTGSRGALIAAFAGVVVWLFLAGGRFRRALLLMPLVVGAALLTPGIGSRLTTLLQLTDSGGVAATDPSLIGRIDAQRVALQVLVDHPVLGVGPGLFQAVEPGYLRRLGLDTIVLAPHNSYLEAAAETGILGLTAWLLLLGSAVVVALRVRRLVPRDGEGRELRAVADATAAALVGWALASAFLHLATFRSFLLVVAIGAAVEVHARRQSALHPRAAVPLPRVPSRVVTRRAVGAAAALAVLGAGLMVTATGASRPWTATAGLQLVVRTPDGGQPTPYELAVLTRPDLIRTYATIAADAATATGGAPGTSVTVSNQPPSGLVSISASGRDAATVRAAADAVRNEAADRIGGLGGLYGVRAVDETRLQHAASGALGAWTAAVPFAGAVAILLWLFLRSRPRWRPGSETLRSSVPAGRETAAAQ